MVRNKNFEVNSRGFQNDKFDSGFKREAIGFSLNDFNLHRNNVQGFGYVDFLKVRAHNLFLHVHSTIFS